MEHPPVYTCAEAGRLRPEMSGASTKNLFLCDKKGRRFFLVTTDCEKSVDLQRLAEQIGVPRLRFASAANLERLLGVGPGAVTLLGLVNDVDREVELWVDAAVWSAERFLCHPLVNTATLSLDKATLVRFVEITGHEVHLFG